MAKLVWSSKEREHALDSAGHGSEQRGSATKCWTTVSRLLGHKGPLSHNISLIPCYCQVIFHCKDIPRYFFFQLFDRRLGCSTFSVINTAAFNISI